VGNLEATDNLVSDSVGDSVVNIGCEGDGFDILAGMPPLDPSPIQGNNVQSLFVSNTDKLMFFIVWRRVSILLKV